MTAIINLLLALRTATVGKVRIARRLRQLGAR